MSSALNTFYITSRFTTVFAMVHWWFTVGSLLVHCRFIMHLQHFADAERDCAPSAPGGQDAPGARGASGKPGAAIRWSGVTWTGIARDPEGSAKRRSIGWVAQRARSGQRWACDGAKRARCGGGAARGMGQVRHARQASQARQARLSSRTSTTARFIDDC